MSNRLTYADLNGDGEILPGEIIEENNYYPFGLRHKGYNELASENSSGFKYKFGGKELNDELGFEVYDFGARNYDPALGRWMNIDPLAEEMRRHSPYNYAFNNPVFFIDPDGMAPAGFDKSKLDELKPIVDINEMLAYEPADMGMGLKKATDPPGGGDDGEVTELEELVIYVDRNSIGVENQRNENNEYGFYESMESVTNDTGIAMTVIETLGEANQTTKMLGGIAEVYGIHVAFKMNSIDYQSGRIDRDRYEFRNLRTVTSSAVGLVAGRTHPAIGLVAGKATSSVFDGVEAAADYLNNGFNEMKNQIIFNISLNY